VLASLAGLAVICTALAFVLFFALIADAGPARAAVITYVNPAVAVALGILALGERLTTTMAVAFVLILGGSVLATRSARPAPESGSNADTVAASDGRPEGSVPAGSGVAPGNTVSAGMHADWLQTPRDQNTRQGLRD
jgi:hypothetical protein